MSTEKNYICSLSPLERIAIVYGVEITRGWQARLAREMDLTNKNLVSAWKKRGVPGEVIVNVALEKGIRKEWLETGQGEKYIKPYPDDPPQLKTAKDPTWLTDEQQRLLNAYAAADHVIRQAALTMLENSANESWKNAGGGSEVVLEQRIMTGVNNVK